MEDMLPRFLLITLMNGSLAVEHEPDDLAVHVPSSMRVCHAMAASIVRLKLYWADREFLTGAASKFCLDYLDLVCHERTVG